MWTYLSCRRGFEPRATSFSHRCSNHWATTTFQDSHTLFSRPLQWESFNPVFMKGQNLIIVMLKAFSIHKLWLLSRGGGVSSRHQKGVLTAHNWWSVEYETAASGTTQQYKGKMWESWKSRVVIAQWLEHRWLKLVALGSNPWRQLRFFHIFRLLFFRPL